ncbi:MAG: HD domain-containing phosphohydrolase [Gemmatimonadaceae bacterium]
MSHAFSHPTTGLNAALAFQRRQLLVVDDDEPVLNSIATFFRRRGFIVLTATGAESAIASLHAQPVDAMITDVRMPGMSGLELVPRALEVHPTLAVVVLSGVDDAASAREALTDGALDYLTKPVDLVRLEESLEQAIHRRRLDAARQHVEDSIRQEVALRTMELERQKHEFHTAVTLRVTEALISAMEAKSEFLRGHSRRVGALAASIAEAMFLPPGMVEQVRLAGQLHDVGMIGVRETVLHKEGGLTTEEYAHVQGHVDIGLEILGPLRLGVVEQYVADHHERYDGRGYPQRTAGEEISIGGRILAVSDAYDALTSRRPGRDALPPAEALGIIASHLNTRFDPEVYLALARVIEREGGSLRYVA